VVELVLASASPRRRALLEGLGFVFSVAPADVPEAQEPGEAPSAFVRRVAAAKAAAVRARSPGVVVLAADTEVVLGDAALGKPADAADASRTLARLSGRTHEVLTGVAVLGSREDVFVVRTEVTFRPLTAAEIAWYVATGEPEGKAGSYAIQGRGGAFVSAIAGSHSNVIGLPLAETVAALARAGVPLPWSAP
jgi:septum formation protein